MRIAQIAPVFESIPPKAYGGTERVVYELTEELVKRGHEVTLFASGNSKTSARLVSVLPKGLSELKQVDNLNRNEYSLLNFGMAYKMQKKFDIIHDHNISISLPTANVSQTPVVITLHAPFQEVNLDLYKELTNPHLVAISLAQKLEAPFLNYAGTVYNGLNMKHYPLGLKDKGYLLFVGRITEAKGVHIAIEVAEFLNLPLLIAARLDVSLAKDIAYFKKKVKPKLNNRIVWLGEVNEKERNKLMSEAICMLHPASWSEPFGLTLIEAMACGCPVIAMNKGSIPEIVVHNKTGFIVNDPEEMMESVALIGRIDRRICRKHVIGNFNTENMTDGYEAVYRHVLNLSKENRDDDSGYPGIIT